MTMNKFTFFIIYYLSINFASAQENNELVTIDNQSKDSYNWVIDYPDNIRSPFTNSEIQKLKYVYADNLKKYILDKPSRILDIKHIFRNRVFVQKEDLKDISAYPLLSTVPTFDTFNNKMNIPDFNKENFNPLLYNFNFNSKSRLIYRVDNTTYLIIIKSKFN